MSDIWLGTISPPYESAAFWIAGEDKADVVSAVEDELVDYWGEERPFEWHNSTDTYAYCENSTATAEVRKIRALEV